MIVRVKLPDDQSEWRPPLFPGSGDARAAGCRCPELQPWPGEFDLDDACDVHGLERQPQ